MFSRWLNSIFGCSAQLLSDNDSQFVTELIREFINLIGREHIRRKRNEGTVRRLRNLIFLISKTIRSEQDMELFMRA